jgi:hypothetical protein
MSFANFRLSLKWSCFALLGWPLQPAGFWTENAFWPLTVADWRIYPASRPDFILSPCYQNSPSLLCPDVTSWSPTPVLERFVYCVGSIFESYARARLSEQFARHAFLMFLKAIVRGKCGIWWTWRVWKSCFVKLSSSVPWNMMMILWHAGDFGCLEFVLRCGRGTL